MLPWPWPGSLCLLLLVSACGGDGSALVISVLPGSTTIPATSAPQGRQSIAVAAAGGEVAVAWSMASAGGGIEIGAQLFASNLSPLGAKASLSGPSQNHLVQPTICGDSGVWAAAWTDVLPNERLPGGVTLDRTNVLATLAWSGSGAASGVRQVHPNVIGEQKEPEVACLAGGGRAVTWANSCVAVERVGIGLVHFKPAECQSEPPDGSYLQVLDDAGELAGAVVQIGDGVGRRIPVAPLDSGRFLVLAGSRIQVRSPSGALVDELVSDQVDFSDAALSCAGSRCAAAVGGDELRVWVIDPASLASIFVIEVAEAIRPAPNETLRPVDAGLACDSSGVCLATWLSLHETEDGDSVVTEPAGIFGRGLDLDTGRLGAEALLVPAPEDPEGMLVAALGDGLFVTTRVAAGNIILENVQVR